MKKSVIHIVFSTCFLLFLSLNSLSQTTYKDQEELKRKANEYFQTEDYSSAMPLYSQLVSIYPKDPTYNYRFGVCLIFADRRDNEKPIKYLEFASSKTGVDDEVHYFLGLAYHQVYRFADAIKEYNIYKDKAANKNVEKYDVERQIEICNNAKTLLTKITDLYVLQKTEVVTKDFFRSYDVDRFGGKILVKPDIFKTPLDKKKEKFSLCFFSKANNEVYFSSYGKDGKTGKDIYVASKEKDGTWGKPVSLGNTINTPYDEDFPFMLADGATLYFSSKGRNTIGGYDIFSTTMDNEGVWQTPENLNYPINTPFDDIMFVPDSSGKYAYFSSERASMEGMITVYRVRMDTRPEIDEQLVFDKPSDNDSSYAQTLQFLKEKATLDVNATESMFSEKDNAIANNNSNVTTEEIQDNISEEEITDNLSNQDIINLAEKQSLQAQKELSDLKTKRNVAKTIAENRKTQSETKYAEAEKLINNAAMISDENAKKTQLSKAASTKSEAEELYKESGIASNIVNQLDKQIVVKQKEADEAAQYAREIKIAIQSNSVDSSIAILERMTEKLENSAVDTTSYENNPNEEFVNQKAAEAEKLYLQSKALSEEITSMNEKAESYRKQADETKKKTLKEEYLKNANDLEAEVKIKQSELDEILQKTEKIQNEGDSAKTISDLYANVIEDIQNNNTSVSEKNQTIATNYSNTTTQLQNDNSINNNINTSQKEQTKLNTDNTNNTSQTSTTFVENKTETNTNSSQNIVSNQEDQTESNAVANATTSQENTLSKSQIIQQSDQITKTINASLDSLKKQADNAYGIAYNKNEQSLKKQKEAENLKAESSAITDPSEQEKYLKKADILEKEALELARNAVVAYSVAQHLENSYNQDKIASETVSELIQEAKDAANEGNTADAQEMLNEIKLEQLKINASKITELYYSELSNSLDSKENELEQSQQKSEKLQSKADSLSSKAKELRKQANETSKPSRQKEIIKQAEQVEERLAIAQKEADASSEIAESKQEEVAELKMKVSYSPTIVKETVSDNKSLNSSIDKTTLEKNIQEYKDHNVFAENITSISEANNASITTADNTSTNIANKTNESITEKNNATVTDKTTNNINQNSNLDNTNNQFVSNNTNTSKSTTTSVVSETTHLSTPQQVETKAEVIDKTVVTIRTRIKALQGELALITEEEEKADISKEISQLQNDLTVLEKQSSEMHADAKSMNNSQEVIASTEDYNTLAENLQNEASNDLDNAQEKRKEANSVTDKTEKENLRKEADELEKTAQSKTLESYDVMSLGNTSDFYLKATQIDSLNSANSSSNQTTTANLLNNEAKYYFDKAKALEKTIEKNDMTYAEQKSTYNDILSNQKLAIEKQQQAIDLYKKSSSTLANNSNNSTVTNDNSQIKNNDVNTNTVIQADKINTTIQDKTLSENNTSKTNSENSVSNTSNIVEVNKTTTTTTYSTENAITPGDFKGIYINEGNALAANKDASNLIPVNSDLPAGIVFKVQFCALNKQVSPDIFSGITPVTAESTNFGIYRYLAGLFAKYDDAVTARNLIRPMGYADAFIVAYNNGKRITVGEALTLLKADNSLSTTYAELNNKAYVSTGTSNTNTVATNTTTTTNASTLSNPVSTISGLFYSVQVGVYAKPVTSDQLFNITPLYDEIMTNGYYRYLSGTYSNIQDAVNAKNTIVTKGVTDAFVVVYYNGKKITFAEAKALATENTNLAIVDNNNAVIKNTTTTAEKTLPANDISFKVQIGAYKKDVPIEMINQWLDNAATNGLEHYVNENGLTIYTSGNFKDYNSANDYKNTLVAKGITDAYIVAFNGKEKIAVTKAIELLK